jgi:cellulose synthase/poly-beta-1,6-N-acetylglucosamine synthase-like glycosyltransferase
MIAVVFWSSVALIAYTYFGYPLVLALVARRPRRYPALASLPTVSVVVAAYDEEAVIGRKVDELRALDYPAELVQVIVAADGSSDRTAEIAAARGVEVLHRPERLGKSAAIGRAARTAGGEIIAFSDANNRWAPGALRALVAPFGDPEVGAVTGKKVSGGDDGLGWSEGAYWRYESFIRTREARLGSSVGVNGEIFAVRRSLLSAPPAGIVNDDAWMAHSVIAGGGDVAFAPDALSIEPVSAAAADEVERRTRMVAGFWQMLARLPGAIPWRRPVMAWQVISHKLLRHLVPIAMAAAALAALAALATPGSGFWGLGAPWNAWAVGLQAAFYAVALAGPGGVGYVPRFLVASNAAALAGLWRHLRGTQDAAWERAERVGESA